uniref:SAM pointed domain containing ETS transcription factor n=1 Tax=Scophthalmus maximus TaxID=52904 RepID=A0A8D3A684_SCOMX
MANSVGGLSEGTAYGPRIGMTGDSLALLERNRGAADPWDMVETKPNVDALERGLPGLYLSCFDMPLAEDATWLAKVSEAPPMAHMGSRDEPEQCPVIDSQEQGLSPAGLQGQEEERSLEQVQSMVVGEVLKDIETACKLLNITPDPIEWHAANVQKWLLWTEHLYRLPHAGKAFQELTGKDLCAMSEEEFRQRSPQCGDTLHAHLDIWKSGKRVWCLFNKFMGDCVRAYSVFMYDPVWGRGYGHHSFIQSLKSYFIPGSILVCLAAAWMKERCSAGDTKTAGSSSARLTFPKQFEYLSSEGLFFFSISVDHNTMTLATTFCRRSVAQALRSCGPRRIRPVPVSRSTCGSSSGSSCSSLTATDAASAGSTKKKVPRFVSPMHRCSTSSHNDTPISSPTTVWEWELL